MDEKSKLERALQDLQLEHGNQKVKSVLAFSDFPDRIKLETYMKS